MYIVYNSADYQVGKVHYIDKNATYTVLNEDTKETSTLSGASFITRLKKDIKLSSYTFKNVGYKSKPILYQDVKIDLGSEKAKSIKIDIFSGVVENPASTVDVSVVPIQNNKGYITVNNLVLGLNILSLPVYESNYRFKPYKLLFANDIQIIVSEDCQLKSIIFDKVEFSQTAIKFTLIFNIFNSVYNSYNSDSVELPVIIDFKKHLLVTKDKKIALPTVLEYTKQGVLGKNNKVAEFEFDKFSKLSNYYTCKMVYDNRVYLSSEAAYQSMKTIDSSLRDKFSNLTPDEAKALGRKIEASNKLRPDWDKVKFDIMHDVILAKFSQNQDCKDDLFRTKGFNLVENTTGWCDKIWGRCHCESCNGAGENHLGLILTAVRKELGCNE